MIQGKQVFTYIDSSAGVNQDGEKYIAINVMTKGTNKKKLSFVAKRPDVIDKISQMKFVDFQDIVLILDFERVFNKEKRTSYWTVELIGVGRNNTNN